MSSRRRTDNQSPRWRSSLSTSHKKPRPATSVSLVFAQPLQSSPLRSAIDNLPTVAGVDDTTSLTDGMSRKSQRARGESVASTVTSIPGSVDHRQANPDKDRSSIHDADNHTTPPDDVNDASTNAPVIIDLTEDVTISQQPASPPLLDPIPTSSSLLSPENPNHYELSDSPEPIPSKDLPLINDPIPPADKELQAPLDVHPSPLPNSTLNPTLPKSVTPTSVPGKPSSRKTSWFSSLATSKGKQKTILSDVKTSEATSALSNPIANVVVSQPEGSAIDSTRSNAKPESLPITSNFESQSGSGLPYSSTATSGSSVPPIDLPNPIAVAESPSVQSADASNPTPHTSSISSPPIPFPTSPAKSIKSVKSVSSSPNPKRGSWFGIGGSKSKLKEPILPLEPSNSAIPKELKAPEASPLNEASKSISDPGTSVETNAGPVPSSPTPTPTTTVESPSPLPQPPIQSLVPQPQAIATPTSTQQSPNGASIDSIDSRMPPSLPLTLPAASSSAPNLTEGISVPSSTSKENLKEGDPETIRARTASVSSLNPSSSRFMLRIPLLGRTKMPLPADAQLGSARSRSLEDERSKEKGSQKEVPEAEAPGKPASEITKPKDVDILQALITPPPAQQTTPDISSPTPTTEPVPSSEAVTSPPTETPEQSHSSPDPNSTDPKSTDQPLQPSPPPASATWWDYLGLGSKGDTQQEQNAAQQSEDPAKVEDSEIKITVETAPEDTAEVPKVDDQAVPQPETQAPTLPTPTTPEPPEGSSARPAKNDDIVPDSSPEIKKTPSILSSETTASAWYSPWAWYAAAPAAPLQSSSTEEQADEGQGEGGHQKQLTESQIVKEEALARDPASEGQAVVLASNPGDEQPPKIVEEQSSSSAADPGEVNPVSPSVGETNPIEQSVSANRSGWASFFMSRSLLVKSITAEGEKVDKDEHGAEVMNIDDDELEAVGGESAVQVAGSPSTGKELVRSVPNSPLTPTPKSPNPPPPTTGNDKETKKPSPVQPPLTTSESIKRDTVNKSGNVRSPSPAPSKKSGAATPTKPAKESPPNLVLPTWSDTFHTAPRNYIPPKIVEPPRSTLSKTLSYVGGMIWSQAAAGGSGQKRRNSSSRRDARVVRSSPRERTGSIGRKGKERDEEVEGSLIGFGKELPKALDILGENMDERLLNGEYRVAVIGVAGWSPGAVTRTLAGGFPSSSSKFVDMTVQALEKFEQEHGIKFKKITRMPLDGDGTVEKKTLRVHTHLLGNAEWMDDLHAADIIFVATHSQGSIVSTHLLERLIQQGHILTPRNVDILASSVASIVPGGMTPDSLSPSKTRTQRICCLALCGIHLGPLRYMRTSSLLQPYFQYLENPSARELFEFQDTESQLSKQYIKALRTVMDHGAKMVYVASLNDQVVPIYSGLFTAASHPRILRAMYIDGDAYHSSDFLSNLLVLLIRIMNTGLSDSGLLAHLSEATAGTLSGVGHSSVYEELNTFSLAVNYAFLVDDGPDVRADLVLEPFNAVNEQNDYEIPWSLRDLIADERVSHFFSGEFTQLRDAFADWSPKTSILRDVKRKLQPIQRLNSIRGGHHSRL